MRVPISTRQILDAAPDEDGPWASGRIVLVARNKSRGKRPWRASAEAAPVWFTPYILPISHAWPK